MKNKISVEVAAKYREEIAEYLGMICIQAQLGQQYCAIADDVGLRYAGRRLTASVRAALGVMTDLARHLEEAERLDAENAA